MENTICPLDNRYLNATQELSKYFSYKNWIKYRIQVELNYFEFIYHLIPELHNNISLGDILTFTHMELDKAPFFEDIIQIESEIKHDIKAIEIFLRKQFDKLKIGHSKYKEFIHFGLTSQDINSVAFSLQLKDCMSEHVIPKIENLVSLLYDKSLDWKSITMLALTHGQPAIPTTLGKEVGVFITRIWYCFEKLQKFEYYTKIGGAVGTLAAHYITYPDIDWVEELNNFCKRLGFIRWKTTTQITNYEDIIEICQILQMINNVLIDFCQDMWLYISNKVFILNKETSSQVGSSTMPQKINPINFENAEGNLKLANSGFVFFVSKLAVSRLQRDLTDTTVLRSFGMNIGYMMLSISNIEKGINQLKPNLLQIKEQLNNSPEILGEAIQCILRKNGLANGYETIRKLTQSVKFDNIDDYKQKIIEELDCITDEISDEIAALTFDSYLGYLSIE